MEKRTANEDYDIHGNGVRSLIDGFEALRMPESRRAAVLDLVRAVVDVNQATGFRWYKTDGTDELACYWDGAHRNTLWITRSEIHMRKDEDVAKRPPIPTTWQKDGGHFVGWLLPGAVRGAGGGPRRYEPKTVLCPNCFINIPAGTECPDCGFVV